MSVKGSNCAANNPITKLQQSVVKTNAVFPDLQNATMREPSLKTGFNWIYQRKEVLSCGQLGVYTRLPSALA